MVAPSLCYRSTGRARGARERDRSRFPLQGKSVEWGVCVCVVFKLSTNNRRGSRPGLAAGRVHLLGAPKVKKNSVVVSGGGQGGLRLGAFNARYFVLWESFKSQLMDTIKSSLSC